MSSRPAAVVYAAVNLPMKRGQTKPDSKLVRVGAAWESERTPGDYTLILEALPIAYLNARQLEIRLQLVQTNDRER